ncbi:probable aspartyl protease At4g16563 [Andrographis paniculata]|uniref:probable aspartyl protease At4g16563 n=1 Tax=Andrographis paniculata TaxID=175694 RepID=UPI0021E93D77|nr:probable aspartyl protease At4g16563 [Andrographis paniculata]
MPYILFLFLLPLFALSAADTTTLSLSPTAAVSPPLTDPWLRLNRLAAASAARAHHLKYPKANISSVKVPLFPRGYGGYSVSLSIGTPPQELSFVMDTGSSLVWFPCTQRYACSSCDFPESNPANISTFIPKSSSSSRIVGCQNPKCRWLFPEVQCRNCRNGSTGCTEFCPPYIVQYGSGSTSGLLLSETLIFPEKTVGNFIIGCSVFSSRQPAGIAGFGRGPESLPAQMGLTKFSYCLVSHRFDNMPASSDLVLSTGGGSAAAPAGIRYTPFRKNPTSSNPVYKDYYYVTLRKITVGGVKVKVPYKHLVPDSAGNGGTIVDSGTTFTFMEKHVFQLVAQEFEKQVERNYSRSINLEKQSGLEPCFNVSGEKLISLPQLIFHFKGGAKMILPLADYFSFLDDSVICMTVITNSDSSVAGAGPAIILGNYQQQNFYIEYDLQNQRLGFLEQICK